MPHKQDQSARPTTGTTSPIYIPLSTPLKTVNAGNSYFLVKIYGAQAAFSGRFWEQVKQLIVTSQVSLNHPLLGPEPLRAIRRCRAVEKGRAEQLGLSPNLINLVPATMDRVSISIEFILDTKNRLAALSGLINDDTFISAISVAPGVALAARTIGGLSQKIIQTFLEPQDRLPILQFSGDFNIPTGDLRDGYYVILGSRDEDNPLPSPMPELTLSNGGVLAGGRPITQLSYVVFEVRSVEARTRDLNEGASWETKLRQAEGVVQGVANNLFAEDEDKQQAWKECARLLHEAQLLLIDDPNYLRREAQDIIKAAYVQCRQQIFSQEQDRQSAPSSHGLEAASSWLDSASDRALLGIALDDDLEAARSHYAEQVAATREVLRQAGAF